MTMVHKPLCRLPLIPYLSNLLVHSLCSSHTAMLASSLLFKHANYTLLSQNCNINWPSDVHMSYSLISFRTFLECYLPKRAHLAPSIHPAHFFSTIHSPFYRPLSLFIGLPNYNINLWSSNICVPFISLGYTWHR